MKRKRKIAIGCLSTVAILILAPVIFFSVVVYKIKSSARQVDNYINTLTERDAQRWIAQTEALLTDNVTPNFEDLPFTLKPLVYSGDDSVLYHFCLGLVCGANLTVNRLPEGGHEIIATFFNGQQDKYIYPKKDINHEPHELSK